MLYLIANWKSHKSIDESIQWIDRVAAGISQLSLSADRVRVVVAPPSPFIFSLSDQLKKQAQAAYDSELLSLAAQTISGYESGAYTGDVSGRNLEGSAVRFAICGHSERRKYAHETSQDVSRQVDQALRHNLTPVLCVDKDTWEDQLAMFSEQTLKDSVIAYEPAASIGTGLAEELGTTLDVVRDLRTRFGNDLQILYGGSVTSDNVRHYLDGVLMNGVLVGSASLDADHWLKILSASSR